MALARIKGYITKTGELQVELPEGLPSGEVTVTIEAVILPEDETPAEIPPTWTDQEIEAMLQPNPKSGAEIVASGHTGGWEHKE